MSTILKQSRELFELGTFEIVSGKVRISDPCYKKRTWCAGTIDNTMVGIWKAQVIKTCETVVYPNEEWARDQTFDHNRNILIAVHESFDKSKPHKREKAKFHGGMDAGMAGIFDDQFYKKDYKEDYIQVGHKEYEKKQRDWQRSQSKDLDGILGRSEYKFSQEQEDSIALSVLKGLVANLPDRIKESKRKKGWGEFVKRDTRRLKEAKARLARYEQNPCSENLIERTKDWYEVCCDKSLSNLGAGVINYGVVSSSGYGDGGYSTWMALDDNNQVVAIKLQF